MAEGYSFSSPWRMGMEADRSFLTGWKYGGAIHNTHTPYEDENLRPFVT